MNKKLIRLTEADLHRIVKKSVNKVIREGKVFSHQNDEWGNDYFVNAKSLLMGMSDALNAMEDEANSDSYEATMYLYRNFIDRFNQLKQIIPLIKKCIKEPEMNI